MTGEISRRSLLAGAGVLVSGAAVGGTVGASSVESGAQDTDELPVRWNRTYSDATYNGGTSLVEDGDQYVVLGQSGAQATGSPGWLFGTDATTGEGEWLASVENDDLDRQPTFQTHCPAVDGDGFALLGLDLLSGTGSLVRTDADGSVEWWETYEGDGEGASLLIRDVIATNDGYLLVGSRTQDQSASAVAIRVDAQGAEQSQTRMFTDRESEVVGVVPDGDGYVGIAASGTASGEEPVRPIVFRADADDEIQWDERFTAPTDGDDPLQLNQLIDLTATEDGFVAVGYAAEQSFDTVDGWVISVDDEGNERAGRRLSPSPVTLFTAVTSGGDGITVAGNGSESANSQEAVGIVGELGDGLEPRWSKTVSVGATNNIRDIVSTSDDGIVAAGITQYESDSVDPQTEAWLVKFGGEEAPSVTAIPPASDTTVTPSETPTGTPTSTPSPTPTATPSPTPSPTAEPTPAGTATATGTETPSDDVLETTSGDGPGFGAAGALAALGGGALLRRGLSDAGDADEE